MLLSRQPNLLLQPCTQLKNVGEKTASLLEKCGIVTIQDLLFHLPLRYQDKTRITAINQLVSGEHAVIQGDIVDVKVTRSRKPSLVCYLDDGTGVITLRFFNFSTSQKKQFDATGTFRCFGEVRFWNDAAEMIHPEYRQIQPGYLTQLDETLTPIYPSTEKLHQSVLRRLTTEALMLIENGMTLHELIPGSFLQKSGLPTLTKALQNVHRPPSSADLIALEQGSHPAQQRLILEELLAQHLSLRRLRKSFQVNTAPLLSHSTALTQNFLDNLDFQLTSAQQRVLQEISG